MDLEYALSQTNVCAEQQAEDCGIIVFGASGDLVHRKLIPALYGLMRRRLLPPRFYILGFARSDISEETFRERMRKAIIDAHGEQPPDMLNGFLAMCRYSAGDYNDPAAYNRLAGRCSVCDKDFDSSGNRLFYLALPPELHPVVVERLAETGMTAEGPDRNPWARVVFEKPFGHDLQSAIALDNRLARVIASHQIFRMDHYLGKETVQSVLMFRFANAIFEPLWNRSYIDHVQISTLESIGVEHRGGYYDQAGCLRDMFQNHMLQMLAITAMEPPISFYADRVREERTKLLRSIRPWSMDDLGSWIVRGQYAASPASSSSLPDYNSEHGVRPDSTTETYVAAKLLIDNWRWQGVPFYLRSGKGLQRKSSEIAVTFKRVPYSMFGMTSKAQMPANVLILKIQPDEGIDLTIQTKQPGPKSCMSSMALSFKYQEVFGITPPNAYERLLLDCMQGDRTLFWSREGVEAAWQLIDPVLAAWREKPHLCPLHRYPVGSWGPEAADELVRKEGRRWRRPPEMAGTHEL
ncbi:glucose-6-phosphate dehydrogenase [Desulfovibrio mangrovi]|uniref:glucose-6-phosphate dehydrogenase n=1 Tax=Desulfovibrio mangrovi TaxID=2976983 RepID=UPI002245C0AC|nr:glucose-6-phosphate dehydrogenase [Desulfovibrio mangrovi]UZP66132.1 glucose-6-phosphate dehydrogenase [Desulfovibrio mangrovi]